MSLIKSELRKVVYVRANWGILLASVVISIISVVITPFIFAAGNVGAGLTLDSPQAIDAVYANAISGYIFVIILGIMLMAGEYRHGTAVATFLASPKREIVLAAKLGIAAIVGAVFMLISVWASIFAGIIVLAGFDNAAAPFQRHLSEPDSRGPCDWGDSRGHRSCHRGFTEEPNARHRALAGLLICHRSAAASTLGRHCKVSTGWLDNRDDSDRHRRPGIWITHRQLPRPYSGDIASAWIRGSLCADVFGNKHETDVE